MAIVVVELGCIAREERKMPVALEDREGAAAARRRIFVWSVRQGIRCVGFAVWMLLRMGVAVGSSAAGFAGTLERTVKERVT
jgi:hypothetical protein